MGVGQETIFNADSESNFVVFFQIYRGIKVKDLDLGIRANVTYIEGLNNAERQQLAQMLVRAYVDGLNAASNLQVQRPHPCEYCTYLK